MSSRRKLKFAPGRLWGLIGIASSTIGLIIFLNVAFPDWRLSERIGEGFRQLGELYGILPSAPLIGPLQLGHIVIILIASILVLLIFFRRTSKEELEVEAFRDEQRQFREEQKLFRKEQATFQAEQRSFYKEQRALLQDIAANASESLSFTDADIVNAPVGEVWDFLRGTLCGPACRELLGDVNVNETEKDSFTWEGTGLMSGQQIVVGGKTEFEAPGEISFNCSSGALKGFRSRFELTGTPNDTKVKLRAKFTPGLTPSEFSFAARELNRGLPAILEGTLSRLKARLEDQAES